MVELSDSKTELNVMNKRLVEYATKIRTDLDDSLSTRITSSDSSYRERMEELKVSHSSLLKTNDQLKDTAATILRGQDDLLTRLEALEHRK